jgi:hypothetical protein
MAFGGGYESDLNLSNVKLLGDFSRWIWYCPNVRA